MRARPQAWAITSTDHFDDDIAGPLLDPAPPLLVVTIPNVGSGRPMPMKPYESVYALGQALLEHASPLGQSAWRKFYSHSPIPPKRPLHITSSIPASILERIGATKAEVLDNAPTEIMNFHGETAPIPAGETALSPSQVSLLAPTKPPAPPSEVDSVPAVRQRDKKAYLHVEAEMPLEDPSGAATVASGERSAEWFDVSSPDVLSSSGPPAPATTAATGKRSDGASPWRGRIQGRRLQLGLGAAVALLAASTVVLLVHRPEEHLIHAVRLSPPSAAAVPVASPPAPSESPAVRPTLAPATGAKARVTDAQTTSSVVAPLDEVPRSNNGRRMEGTRPPRHHRKVHPEAEEVTPDGVPLVR